MLFKNPDFLYFLFLLAIPIIVHLFQLRKFKKTAFTNVKFLKRVVIQTRKSSQLKKWLVLLARCLALACIVLAFAQPFIPRSDVATKPVETVVYLDNSFSMQLEGQRGELLKRAIQDFLASEAGFPPEKEFTLMTNDNIYRNSTISQLKKELLQLDYSSEPVSLNTILLRAENEFEERPGIRKQLIAISDIQQNSVDLESITTENIELGLVQLLPENVSNVSVDSLYISEKGMGDFKLTILLSHTGKNPGNVPVSLYNGKTLLAKTGANFDEGAKASVELALSNNNQTVEGRIEIQDEGLVYDNSLYFSINPPGKIKVVVLGKPEDGFLQRIFKGENFEFKVFPKGGIDYNQLTDANMVVLNELETIPGNLAPILQNLIENGGNLAVIPSRESELKSYNILLENLDAPRYSDLMEDEKNITEIVYAHPLLEGVFDKRVENFQYPETRSNFGFQGFSRSVLNYAGGDAFLVQNGSVYLFAASLVSENSNFKNSPLVVPVFYNIAKQSLKSPELYYEIGQKNTYEIPVELEKDQIVSIESLSTLPTGGQVKQAGERAPFVPQQRVFDNKVQIMTTDFPEKAGIYKVVKDGKSITNLSYNYPRDESDLRYADVSQLKNVAIANNVGEFLENHRQENQIDKLWKWFVIFAVFFLVAEVLLLRFLK